MKDSRKTAYVIFRYDDFSSSSPTNMEEKIVSIFKKHDLSLTISVIPFIVSANVLDPSPQPLLPLQEDKAVILKRGHMDGTVNIALHGHAHQVVHPENRSEFAGLDAANQLEKLAMARSHLEKVVGVCPQVFVPPWNAYDHATLTALEKLGFTTLSADRRGLSPKNSALAFVPATCSLHQTQDAIREAQRSTDPQPIIVVLFHVYDFIEHDASRGRFSLGELDALLAWLTALDAVLVLSVAQAVEQRLDLSSRRLTRARMMRRLQRFYPPFSKEDCLLHSDSGFHGMVFKAAFFFLLLIASAVSIASVAWKLLAEPSARSVM